METQKRTRAHKWETTFELLVEVRASLDRGERLAALQTARRAAEEARKFTSSNRIREETSAALTLADVIDGELVRPLSNGSLATIDLTSVLRTAQRIVKREATAAAVKTTQVRYRRDLKRSAGTQAIASAIDRVWGSLKVRR